MKTWIVAGAMLLTACATVTPKHTLVAAAETVGAYTAIVKQSWQRGRITDAQAARELVRLEKAQKLIHDGWVALAACQQTTPCTGYAVVNQQLGPMLLELERQLREQEAKK